LAAAVTMTTAGALLLAPVPIANAHHGHGHGHGHDTGLPGGYEHLVVIYQENHSFDNLYGGWGKVGHDRVEGLRDVRDVTQVDQHGTPFGCLQQNDLNLASPPLSSTCTDPAHNIAASHFANQLYRIDDYIKPEDKTCPAPGVAAPNGVLKDSPGALPGGCTRDLVHRF
jgi:phospholipase C